MHELVSGKKAFTDDWNVHDYAIAGSFVDISVPLPLPIRSHISENIRRLLAVKLEDRPRASTLALIYNSHCRLHPQMYPRMLNNMELPLTFSEWRAIAEVYSSEKEFQIQLSGAFTGASCVGLWTKLTERFPTRNDILVRLVTACESSGFPDTEINAWMSLVIAHPDFPIFWDRMEFACTKLDDERLAIKSWKHLANELPETPEPLYRLAKWLRERDQDAEFEIWKELVYRFPTSDYVIAGMAEASLIELDLVDEIQLWKELVDVHAWSEPLLSRFTDACVRKGDDGEEISILKDFIFRHGYSDLLFCRLTAACTEYHDVEEKITVWRDLVLRYPYQKRLWSGLSLVCQDEEVNARIGFWRDFMSRRLPDHPEVLRGLALAYRRKGEVVLEQVAWRRLTEIHGAKLWEDGEWDIEQFASWATNMDIGTEMSFN